MCLFSTFLLKLLDVVFEYKMVMSKQNMIKFQNFLFLYLSNEKDSVQQFEYYQKYSIIKIAV